VFVQGADADSTRGRVKRVNFLGTVVSAVKPIEIVTTKALTDCRITAIEKASMIKALEAQPWFSKFFMDHLF